MFSDEHMHVLDIPLIIVQSRALIQAVEPDTVKWTLQKSCCKSLAKNLIAQSQLTYTPSILYNVTVYDGDNTGPNIWPRHCVLPLSRDITFLHAFHNNICVPPFRERRTSLKRQLELESGE